VWYTPRGLELGTHCLRDVFYTAQMVGFPPHYGVFLCQQVSGNVTQTGALADLLAD